MLDSSDWKLLEMLSKNPNMSQSELSKKLGVTQPAVCLRLKKLEKNGVLKKISGLNPDKTDFIFVLVEGKSSLDKLNGTSGFVFGFEARGQVSAVFFSSCKDDVQKLAKDLFVSPKTTVLSEVKGSFVVPVRSQKDCCL
ncbi:MAG: Lrp/AsnC family transcriptional regulator [Candidatus Altiarchaeota archaeon]|nr:Lrp/AsnC family transcriptional regulator [Candidatus Altiarchaeota archaeon]